MQPQIRRVGIVLVFAFLAVFMQLNYLQIFAAKRIAGNNANVRQLYREYSIKRGDILTLDGKVVATSRATNGNLKYERTYPGGELYGHVTGYYSINYGTARIESAYNEELLGEGGVVSIQEIQDRFSGSEQKAGDDVRLTVHSRLQEAAQSALGGNEGSVVAIDPSTGEVRALWANPSFDPSPLASHARKEQRDYWNSLDPESADSPLVNRATQRSYPPGSTFKIVTGGAALESGEFDRDSTFPDPPRLEPCSESTEELPQCMPQTDQSLTNFTKTSCAGGGQIDLFTAMRISCDTTFAMIGLEIEDEIHRLAEELGFNEPLPFDVANEASTYPDLGDDNMPFWAYSALGQGDVSATSLQMALVAATVANGGDVPRPRLVREVRDATGGIVERFSPETINGAMSQETADELTDMMKAVVEDGTGVAAQIPGIEVAGKTGTAQNVEGEAPHAWFIAFAPADDPQLAVAVLVENGGSYGSEATGGAVAAPIAKAVFEADRQIRGW